ELQKSKQLEESMRKLDIEMRRTDELLYQMIPKQVADRLRKGEAAVETCQQNPPNSSSHPEPNRTPNGSRVARPIENSAFLPSEDFIFFPAIFNLPDTSPTLR
ncbi:hypothetical protein TNCT_126161, partial [Trichonephila clavata]